MVFEVELEVAISSPSGLIGMCQCDLGGFEFPF